MSDQSKTSAEVNGSEPFAEARGSDAQAREELSAEVRALIRPLVLEMHKRGWTDVRILKSGTRVTFSAHPNELFARTRTPGWDVWGNEV